MNQFNGMTLRRPEDEQNESRLGMLRTLSVRRGLVAAAVVLWLSSVALFWFEVPYGVGALVGLGALGLWVLLSKLVRSTDSAADSELDERLVAVRNAAYRTAYYVVGVITVLALVALVTAESAGLDIQSRHLTATMWAFVVGATLAPACILAWTQRDV